MVAQGALNAVNVGDGVGLVGGHNGSYALDRANLVDLVIVKAHRRHHAGVGKVGAVVILVPRQAHVGAGHAQAGKEACSQCRDDSDSDKTPPRMGNGANHIFGKCAGHRMHSILGDISCSLCFIVSD